MSEYTDGYAAVVAEIRKQLASVEQRRASVEQEWNRLQNALAVVEELAPDPAEKRPMTIRVREYVERHGPITRADLVKHFAADGVQRNSVDIIASRLNRAVADVLQP